ncbi:MAG TPA: two-component system response regulator CreB [Steroidobacteraceae bacterium]|nr:two-component system response regulator CreB [Steroidobacteraceae bacterium]
MRQILVVEDEVAIADTLLFALTSEGFAAQRVALAAEALELLRGGTFHLVILDVGLPDMTGFEACKLLRAFSAVPVMFLTARGEEIDRVVGLEIGADDYVVKPFSPREVVARVRAILKRSGGATPPPAAMEEFQVDAQRLSIRYLGQPLKLTALEFRLLQQLVAHPEQVQSREQLLLALGMAHDAGYERNIDTHIKALRARLREVQPAREPIQTHRGFGYSYQPAAAPGTR